VPLAGKQSRFAWPLEVGTANRDIRVTCNAAIATVTLTGGTHWWRDDGTANDMATRLIAALQAHPQGPTVTVDLLEDGKAYFESDLSMTIHWADALTTLDPLWCGFAAANGVFVLDGGVYKLTSTYQVGHSWWPEVRYVNDSGIQTSHQVSRDEDLEGKPDTWLWASKDYQTIQIKMLPMAKVFAGDAAVNEDLALLRDYLATGGPMEWCPDWEIPGTYYRRVIHEIQWLRAWPVRNMGEAATYYQVAFPMQDAEGWS